MRMYHSRTPKNEMEKQKGENKELGKTEGKAGKRRST
jgi:hypothetical protein